MTRAGFPDDLVLTPVSRWPTRLAEEAVRAVLGTPMVERLRRRHRIERPAASIVMVTCNGLVFTRLCLESLLASDSSTDFEVIVVDNASTDGTARYLDALSSHDERVRVQAMAHNAGFAAATNRGVALSRGDHIIFLNNDTVPVNPWLEGLVAHLRRDEIGLLGAVTNRAGNEAEIEVPYRTYGELGRFAAEHARTYRDEIFDIRTATMFCAALRREVWDAVGSLDERFAIGLFEDDDFSMRVRRAGLRVMCAEDVFVHHFGQASIGQLALTGQYGALFHANRERWEAKWGARWQPYAKRTTAEYQTLVRRVRQYVCDTVPPGAAVLVVSKGDEELLEFEGRRGWHFPQATDGSYAGHYPADSDACIAELERLRASGAEFLVVPATSRWWLRHYAQFAKHLEQRYGARDDQQAPAMIVALSERAVVREPVAGVS
jgi:GT2 family glycosyltransferase